MFSYEQMMQDHEDKERAILLDQLFRHKPWLKSCLPKLKVSKPDIIRTNFPVTDSDI